MSVLTETPSDATAIRPFTFEAAEADLDDLRERIAATRWPEKEPVDDLSQGVQLATIQALARYWETEYDWRKCEARLNGLPQFVTEIDGLDIHFINVRSKHEVALMTRLGYTRFVAHGGDWGAMVADVMGTHAPPELLGIHLTWPFTVPPEIDQAVQTGSPLPPDLSGDEQHACEQLAFFYAQDLGYAQE